MLSPHELRHTRTTRWIAQGMGPYMKARLLGHSNLKIQTKIYDHTDSETLRGALLAVGRNAGTWMEKPRSGLWKDSLQDPQCKKKRRSKSSLPRRGEDEWTRTTDPLHVKQVL